MITRGERNVLLDLHGLTRSIVELIVVKKKGTIVANEPTPKGACYACFNPVKGLCCRPHAGFERSWRQKLRTIYPELMNTHQEAAIDDPKGKELT